MFKEFFGHFWKAFSRPRVSIFIVIGTAVIFLTFLTNDNALEIAISGFASVFIGIGVNNFTSQETHQKDEQIIRSKTSHYLKVLEMTDNKIRYIESASEGRYEQARQSFKELIQLVALLKQLLKDEELLD